MEGDLRKVTCSTAIHFMSLKTPSEAEEGSDLSQMPNYALFCFVLFYFILFYFILFYFILFCF